MVSTKSTCTPYNLGNLPGEDSFNIMRLMKMLVGLQLMVINAVRAEVQVDMVSKPLLKALVFQLFESASLSSHWFQNTNLQPYTAATATISSGGIRWLFYFGGICAMSFVFLQACDVFYEANAVFPEKARKVGRRRK